MAPTLSTALPETASSFKIKIKIDKIISYPEHQITAIVSFVYRCRRPFGYRDFWFLFCFHLEFIIALG